MNQNFDNPSRTLNFKDIYSYGSKAVQAVYMICDDSGSIVYIGESRNLPNRIEQHRLWIESGIRDDDHKRHTHFQLHVKYSESTEYWIFPVHKFEDSKKHEREHLESYLIRQLRPVGNIKTSPPCFDKNRLAAAEEIGEEILTTLLRNKNFSNSVRNHK